jgi:hypothetical protein
VIHQNWQEIQNESYLITRYEVMDVPSSYRVSMPYFQNLRVGRKDHVNIVLESQTIDWQTILMVLHQYWFIRTYVIQKNLKKVSEIFLITNITEYY